MNIFCLSRFGGILTFWSIFLHLVLALPTRAERAEEDELSKFHRLYKHSRLLQNTHPDSSLLYAGRAADAVRHSVYRKEYSLALSLVSEVLLDIGRAEEGFQQAQGALRIAEEINDTVALAHSLVALGYVAAQQVLPKKDQLANEDVLRLLGKAYSLTQRLRDSALTMQCLNCMGRLFRVMQRFDSAVTYHAAVLNIAIHFPNIRQEAWALYGLSVCSEAQGRLTEALEYELKSLRLREYLGASYFGISLYHASCLYLALGDLPKAFLFAKKSVTVSRQSGDLLLIVSSLHQMSKVYARMGKYKEALEFHDYFKAASDSLRLIESSNDTRLLLKDIALERALREKLAVQKQEEQTALVVKQQYIVVAGVMMLAVMLLVIIIVRMRSERNILLRNQRLQEANTVIEAQYGELRQKSQMLSETSALLQEANTVLANANARLEERDMEKNELMSIVAHDLKNPISAVRGMAELVQEGYIETDQTPMIASQIIDVSDKMLRLVKNLLEIDRIEAGTLLFHLTELNIVTVIQATVAEYRLQAEAKHITLIFEAEVSDSRVIADEQGLMQVLDNLISNAVKYSPHGKNIYVRLKSEEGSMKRGDEVTSDLSPQVSSFLRVEIQDE